MIDKAHSCDVVADFWEWYQRRQHSPLAHYALDKCEETFMRCEWDKSGYWHTIYVRERLRRQASRSKKVPNSN
jgi:hypothetical protein